MERMIAFLPPPPNWLFFPLFFETSGETQEPESTNFLNLHPCSHCLPLTVEELLPFSTSELLLCSEYRPWILTFLGGPSCHHRLCPHYLYFMGALASNIQTSSSNSYKATETNHNFLSVSSTQMGPAKNSMQFPRGITCLLKIRPWTTWNSLLYQDLPLLIKTSFRQLTCFFHCLASLSALDIGVCSPFYNNLFSKLPHSLSSPSILMFSVGSTFPSSTCL